MRCGLFIVVLALLVVGCDSTDEPPPRVSGQYTGTLMYIAEPGPFSPGGPVAEPWMFSLDEARQGQITGVGTLDSLQVTVTGLHDHPDVTLDFMDEQGAFAGRFTGLLSDDGRELDGVYTFDIFFANISVTLRRQ